MSPPHFLLLVLVVCGVNSNIYDPPVKSNNDEEGLRSAFQTIQESGQSVLPPSLWAALSLTDTSGTGKESQENQHYEKEPSFQIDDYWPAKWRKLGDIPGFYLPDLSNVSRDCRKDLVAFYTELPRWTGWTIRMIDSWGKVPDGILGGNTWVLGLRDECVWIDVDQNLPEAHFTGKYCVMTYMKNGTVEEDTQRATMFRNPRIAAAAGIRSFILPANVYSTCMPSTCTTEELEWSVRQHLPEDMEVMNVACQTWKHDGLQYVGRDVTMIVVLSVLGALALGGTCCDVWLLARAIPQPKQGPLRYLLVFSCYTNMGKVFRINTSESAEVISCLHGIRVLTMAWVVIGHAYLMSMYGAVNKAFLPDIIGQQLLPMQIIINGLPSVDTFFFISGLLVAYNLTKEFQRTKTFNLPVFYIHRFIRLAPPILLLCGIFAVFLPLIVTGSQAPLLEHPGNMVDLCRRYWWRDSFFLTNFFFNEFDTESCIPVTWYTSVDFQLYLLTPVFFLPILYRRKPGIWWMSCLLTLSCVIPGVIIIVMELPPTQVLDVDYSDYYDYTKWVYTKPWGRASPYLLGLCLGYFFRLHDDREEKVKLKKWQVAVGWVVAIATLSLVVFGIAHYNTFSGTIQEYNPAESITYGALHRLAWGLGIGWIIFACHLGYGGPINTFLAHPFWQPLSRLTYTTFLVALNMQFLLYIYIPQVPFYYSHFSKVMETVGVIFLAGLCGLVVTLLTESPVLGLERLLLRKNK